MNEINKCGCGNAPTLERVKGGFSIRCGVCGNRTCPFVFEDEVIRWWNWSKAKRGRMKGGIKKLTKETYTVTRGTLEKAMQVLEDNSIARDYNNADVIEAGDALRAEIDEQDHQP